MNNFIQEKKSLVFMLFIILFLLAGALFYYVIYPSMQEVQRLKFTQQSLQADIEILKKQIENKDNLDNEDEVEEESKTIPVSRDLHEVIRLLDEVERKSGTQISNLSFSNYDSSVTQANTNEGNATSQSLNDLRSISMHVSLESPSYSSFLSFLREIEQLDRVFQVNSYSFSNGNDGEFSVQMQMTTYYFQSLQ